MKRSEIVLMIAECLVEPHYPDHVLDESDYILERLEKAGMRFCTKRDLGDIGNLWTPEGWEPEEDEQP